MNHLVIHCPAKINLTLGIKGKRLDGYHELETIMQSISLGDTLHLTRTKAGISLETDFPGLPRWEENLIYQAADRLKRYVKTQKGVHITLKKRIPLAAGLAGGSTDAAGTLRGLNYLWGLDLGPEELEKLGRAIGSDVPFCLQGGTALARGRGEELTFLPASGIWWLVLVKIPVAVSTAAVYQNFRLATVTQQPHLPGILCALQQNSLKAVGQNLFNVLETVTIPWYPEIGMVKAEMKKRGALGALMSGSGPTVFGLAEDQTEALKLAEAFKGRYCEVYVAHTVSRNREPAIKD